MALNRKPSALPVGTGQRCGREEDGNGRFVFLPWGPSQVCRQLPSRGQAGPMGAVPCCPASPFPLPLQRSADLRVHGTGAWVPTGFQLGCPRQQPGRGDTHTQAKRPVSQEAPTARITPRSSGKSLGASGRAAGPCGRDLRVMRAPRVDPPSKHSGQADSNLVHTFF